MRNLNKKVICSAGIIALILLSPSMTFAKGHSGKSGKHGQSGQSGHHGKSGNSGHNGKSGKSGNWGGGNGDNLGESCTPCKGGLSAILLRNDGPSVTVSIKSGKDGGSGKSGKHGKHGGSGKSGKHGKHGNSGKSGNWGNNSFSKYVESGDTFTYSTNGKMNNNIYINGAYLHTSCSKPLNAGMKIGDFTLVSATSARTGDVLCTLPDAPQPNETGSVCGVVYNDLNNNGTQDNGEEGTRGIVVSVLDANGNTKTAKTRITGSYCVEDVATGDAKVTVKESTLPPKANLTAGDNPSDVVVKANVRNDAGKDGYTFPDNPVDETGKVCGVVFLDTNANNKFDRGDELLDNVTVNVKNNNGDNIASGTTASGKYCIANVPAGKAIVDVDEDTLPENSGQVVGEDPSSVTVKAGEDNWAGKDGYGKPDVAPKTGKVCGVVFLDTNANNKFDRGDELLDNVTVNVKNNNGDTIASGTTASGKYCISNVPAGKAIVDVDEGTLPENSGQVVGEDPSSVTVKAGEDNWAGKDGYGKPDVTPKTGKVCGIVFHDVNKNGKKDANEEGATGILIKILAASGNEVKGETATGGNYCISNVPEGSVEVTVVESTLPDGANLTVGTNPTHITVVPNKQNNAGEDGYAGNCTCDCSLCQGGTK